MVELTERLLSADGQIDKENIEEEFGDVEVVSRYIVKQVEEMDDGYQFYYEGEHPAPEGMSYEEDGMSTLKFDVGDSEVFYFDPDSGKIDKTEAVNLYYSFYDEGQEDSDLFVSGGDVDEAVERLVDAFSLVTEELASTYVFEDEDVHLDSDSRRYGLYPDDEEFEFHVGDEDVKVHTCKSQEDLVDKIEEFSEILRDDEDWPPKVERYKYVDALDEEIGEFDEDRFEEVEGSASDRDSIEVVYFSIPGKGRVGVKDYVVAGISYESVDEARESLEVFVEEYGADLDGMSFDLVEFEDYEY